MLAKRIVTILLSLSFEEALECTQIHSISGLLPANAALVTTRPFRSPHLSVSDAGLIAPRALLPPGAPLSPSPGRSAWRTTAPSFWTSCPSASARCRVPPGRMLRQPLEERSIGPKSNS
jgi:magnesium chelatase family protein